jgi:DNA invertase Pin-like site-specific DNA recombinase
MSDRSARPMDGYIRVSRVGERAGDESYISPSVQREAIERWAAYKGVDIAVWHTDEDQSGGTQDRPGLRAAIERALAGETGGIVARDLTRFSRFTEGGLRDLRRLEEAGARLVFTDQEIDTSSPHGRMVYTILLSVSEAALAQLKAGWKTAKSRAIREGRQIGPTPPGYRRARVRNGKPHGAFVPDPDTGPAMTAAYRAAAREGLEAAIPILREAFPTKTFTVRKQSTVDQYARRGRTVQIGETITVEATWNTSTVRRLLAQRVYIGEAYYGDELNPKSHEPLIDRRTFNRAQYAPINKNRPPGVYPLSGIARCATCGNPMIGSRAGVKRPDGTYPRNYRCSSAARKDVECAQRAMIDAGALENYVIDQVALALDENGHSAETVDLRELERDVSEAEAALDAWAGMTRADRERLRGAYQNGLDQRVEELEEAEAALAQAQHEAEHGPGEYADLTGDQLRELTEAAWREALPRLVSSVTVKPGRGLKRQGSHGEGPSARVTVDLKAGRRPRV